MRVAFPKTFRRSDVLKYFSSRPHLHGSNASTQHSNQHRGEIYSQKDRELKTLAVGDIVLTVVKFDPKFPSRGVGIVKAIDVYHNKVAIALEEEFLGQLEDEKEIESGIIVRSFADIDKPLELFYEQIAKRVGKALAETE